MSKVDISKLPPDVRKRIEDYHEGWLLEKTDIDSGKYTYADWSIEQWIARAVHYYAIHADFYPGEYIMQLVNHIVYSPDASDDSSEPKAVSEPRPLKVDGRFGTFGG